MSSPDSSPPEDVDHVITAIEPAWVEAQHWADPETGERVSGERDIGPFIDMLRDDAAYDCTCGEEFLSWSDAEAHLDDSDA